MNVSHDMNKTTLFELDEKKHHKSAVSSVWSRHFRIFLW